MLVDGTVVLLVAVAIADQPPRPAGRTVCRVRSRPIRSRAAIRLGHGAALLVQTKLLRHGWPGTQTGTQSHRRTQSCNHERFVKPAQTGEEAKLHATARRLKSLNQTTRVLFYLNSTTDCEQYDLHGEMITRHPERGSRTKRARRSALTASRCSTTRSLGCSSCGSTPCRPWGPGSTPGG